jgi:hypothetical protein
MSDGAEPDRLIELRRKAVRTAPASKDRSGEGSGDMMAEEAPKFGEGRGETGSGTTKNASGFSQTHASGAVEGGTQACLKLLLLLPLLLLLLLVLFLSKVMTLSPSGTGEIAVDTL